MRKSLVIIAAAFALCAVAGCGQNAGNKVVLIGHIDGLDSGEIVFYDEFNDGEIFGRTQVRNGDFRYRSKIYNPTHVYLYYDEEIQLADLYLEPGRIIVSGDIDDIRNDKWAVATGSPLNDYENGYREKFFDSSLTQSERDSLVLAYMTEAPGYAIQLSNMWNYTRLLPSFNELQMIDKMPPAVQEMQYVKDMRNLLERRMRVEPQAEGCDIVPVYIDIEEKDAAGVPVTLKSVVEKPGNRYVLVDFWATWCGPCRGEIPYLVDAYNAFHDKGFDIYSISRDPDNLSERWAAFIKENAMNWPNVRMNENDLHSYDDYALEGIPDNVLVDCSTGIIIERSLRGEGLKEALAKLLK